ncbi:unnamed protein product [Fraxinus pennsylvanica]|uniref:Uncharacterized protein n=1 Tax=Fraxinus pennsylvanica TaxID=56036 RepID=A0AAD2DT75_9LAMI|nr:unnamed protein product [Fraxinus pennsylvanica]
MEKIKGMLDLNDFINLRELDLSDNKFRSLGTIYGLKNLKVLNLQSNFFNNSIFSSLHGLSSLKSLDLSYNELKGTIQMKGLHALSNLEELDLSSNEVDNFTTPTGIESMHRLQVLKLNYINVSNISNMVQSMRAFSYLKHFHFRYNYVMGSIGSYDHKWATGCKILCTFLTNLISQQSNNQLEGPIPEDICNLGDLSVLDLSENKLRGSVPSCFNPSRIRHVYMNNNQLEGELTYAFYNSSSLVTLDLRLNKFIGSIPQWIGNLSSLSVILLRGIDLSSNKLHGEIPDGLGNSSEIRALNLSHNNLIGTIPETFSNLRLIESLDLSYNNLSGRIPTGLIKLNALAVFNVAHNNLTGMIPENGQFGTFDEVSYQGNPYLCGRPLPDDCASTGSTHVLSSADDESEELGFMDMEFFYISFIISYLSVVLCIATVLSINPHWRKAWFHFIEVYIIHF